MNVSDFLFSPTMRALDRSIHVRDRIQELTADNVANAETPGFQANNTDFKTVMNGLATDKLGFNSEARDIYESHGTPQTDGLNNVDIEKEMVTMAQNQLMHEMSAKLLSKKMATLAQAIRLGR